MKRVILVALLSLLVVSIPSITQPEEGTALKTHDPIYINGNEDFTPENGVVRGSGTKRDPYIITNWKISDGAFGIKIINTDMYFIIHNCYIYRTSSYGIHLDHTTHGSVTECKIEEVGGDGIGVKNSSNTVIAHNETFDSFGSGISLHDSDNNWIEYNFTLRNSNEGIEISHGSDYNRIFGNLIDANGSRGFFGIVVAYDSCNNEILGNELSDNAKGGIHLHDLTEERCNNLVYHNNFWGNGSSKDECGSQWDNGSEGNYWSDRLGWDSNGDGINDGPYQIEGRGIDHYPLMRPWKPSVVAMGIKFTGPDEFVTVANWSEKDVDLTGWKLQAVNPETGEVQHTFVFPTGCILPMDGKLRIHSGSEATSERNTSGVLPRADLYDQRQNSEQGECIWDDLGGMIRIVNNEGKVVDEYEYHWWMGQ